MGVFVIALLVCLAQAAPAFAQGEPPANTRIPPSPLELLLEQAPRLELSEAQREQVDQVRDRLAARNDPLVTQMLRLRRQWQREQQRSGASAASPRDAQRLRIRNAAERIRERIQRNNRTAMQTVNRLLTPPQRAQLRAIIQERRRQAAPRNDRDDDDDDGD